MTYIEKIFEELKFLGAFSITNTGLHSEEYALLPSRKIVRWMIPLNNGRLFENSLALYQPSLKKAKFIKGVALLAAKSGLSKVISRDRVYFHRQDEKIRQIFGEERLYYAIFTGTEGVHRKVTVQVMSSDGDILGYIKISGNEDTGRLLENENEILTFLAGNNIQKGLFPKVLAWKRLDGVHVLALTTLKSKSSKFTSRLGDPHVAFLGEIFQKTMHTAVFSNSKFAGSLFERLNAIDRALIEAFKQRFETCLQYIMSSVGDCEIPFGLCHRDVTPWNMFFHDGKLFVFDWEYARKEYPPLIDIFHFIIQDGILVRHLKADSLLKRLASNQRLIDKYCELIGLDENFLNPLLLCYLLDISLLYLERENGKLDSEIKYKVETWGEMIDLVLKR